MPFQPAQPLVRKIPLGVIGREANIRAATSALSGLGIEVPMSMMGFGPTCRMEIKVTAEQEPKVREIAEEHDLTLATN